MTVTSVPTKTRDVAPASGTGTGRAGGRVTPLPWLPWLAVTAIAAVTALGACADTTSGGATCVTTTAAVDGGSDGGTGGSTCVVVHPGAGPSGGGW